MDRIAIPIILFAILLLLVIQNVTVRIKWQKNFKISIDYMFITVYHTVKRNKKAKKRKKRFTAFLTLAKALLSHSCVTLHKLTVEYAPEDYAQAYFTEGAIQSFLFPVISTIRAFAKDFAIADGAIETRSPYGESDHTFFDISFRIRLYHVFLPLISFFKSYLKRKAKESK